MARVVGLPKGTRPFRVVIDPADDGASVVYAVGDRIRQEFYRRIGLEDLLAPATAGSSSRSRRDGQGQAHSMS